VIRPFFVLRRPSPLVVVVRVVVPEALEVEGQ
jgi:hypothetical protein